MDPPSVEALRTLGAVVIGGLLTMAAQIFFGPMAAARSAERLAAEEANEQKDRLRAAIMTDIALARSFAHHNVMSSQDPNGTRPRAFITFDISGYLGMMYRGEYPELLGPTVASRLIAYLAQARHVNAMIELFERMETMHGLDPKKSAYVERIGHYCKDGILKHLDHLEQALAVKAPGRERAPERVTRLEGQAHREVKEPGMANSARDKWHPRVRAVVESAEDFAAAHIHDYEAHKSWCAERTDSERGVFLDIQANTPVAFSVGTGNLPFEPVHDPSLPGLAALSLQLRAMLDVCFLEWEKGARSDQTDSQS